mmetsp:Transcript_44976/g.106827  ORF Transcript_44976/g.106827 Transcript_44976/m.106827 type:complete len:152 (-) Transcript_44976:42-497(-)
MSLPHAIIGVLSGKIGTESPSTDSDSSLSIGASARCAKVRIPKSSHGGCNRRGSSSRGRQKPQIRCFGDARHPAPGLRQGGLSQKELDKMSITEESMYHHAATSSSKQPGLRTDCMPPPQKPMQSEEQSVSIEMRPQSKSGPGVRRYRLCL